MGSPIQKLFTGLKSTEGTIYVGEEGRLWYDPARGFRVSDGHTAGGLPAVIATSAANIGDLVITGSTISTINANENLNLNSNGTGTVAIIGEFLVSTTGGRKIIQTLVNGTLNLFTPSINNLDAGIDIIGSPDGSIVEPNNTGVMLHITGQDGDTTASRVYNDGVGGYAAYIGRRYDGSSASPVGMTYSTSTLAQNIIARFGATPYTSVGWPSISTARIDMMIRETPTGSVLGSEIQFWTTDINSATIAPQLIINNQGISHNANIIPLSNDSYDLGAADLRWKNLYIGPSSIHLQDTSTLDDIELIVTGGTLYLNGAQNIALGNLVIADTTLKTATPTLDINIGEIGDLGNLKVYRQLDVYNTSSRITFSVDRTGRTQIYAPTIPASSTSTAEIGAFSIIGTPDGNYHGVTSPGGMLHITGNDGVATRVNLDNFGNGGITSFNAIIARSGRGTSASPQQLQANDVMLRIGSLGWRSDTGFNSTLTTVSGGSTNIEFVALEATTDHTRGSAQKFYNAPLGGYNRYFSGQFDSTGVSLKQAVGDPALVDGTIGITFSSGRRQTDAAIPITQLNSPNGVATLDSNGQLAAAQIPQSLLGGVQYEGSWDANTNQPPLTNSTGTVGSEYSISVSGTQNLGTQTGSVSYQAGGFVIYGGNAWQYVPPVSLFTSIASTGSHLTFSTSTGNILLSVDAASNNTTGTIVSRDGSGNFSAGLITANLSGTVTGSLSGNASTAGKLFAATTINSVSFDGSAPVTVHTAGTGISISGTTVTNIGVVTTTTLMALSVTSTYAQSFNTSTLVANAVNAVSATTATSAGTAYSTIGTLSTGTGIFGSSFNGNGNITWSLNTATLMATAVQAGTVTTAAQPAITSVGTLTNLTVTNLITSKNYAGQARDAGTLGAGGTLIIDFATDHNVLVNLTTTAVIGFVNTSTGKAVTVMVKNATGANRAVTLGVVAGNTSGGNAQPNVNDGRTGVLVYRTFGTATTDIYCEFN